MTTYAIHAQVKTHGTNGFEGSRGVPTFYLDSRVQGITDAMHAARIAAGIINPLACIPACDLDIKAVAVDPVRESAELDLSAAEREHAAAVAENADHDAWCAGPMAHLVPRGRHAAPVAHACGDDCNPGNCPVRHAEEFGARPVCDNRV